MARAFYRPFSKFLELAIDTSSTVDLVDSQGMSLPCNFVSVECIADAGQPNAFVTLQASSLAIFESVQPKVSVLS